MRLLQRLRNLFLPEGDIPLMSYITTDMQMVNYWIAPCNYR